MKFGTPQLNSFAILLAGAAVLTFYFVHVLWPLTLPTPWNDEVHFLIPAISFAESGSFTADRMLVHQVFWMPVGSYILNGLVFLITGAPSIHIARAVAFFCITMAALILRDIVSAALGAIDRERPGLGHALVLAWYLSLPVVFAGDIVRADALELLLSLATLDCVLRNRLAGGLGLAILAVTVHPLLAFPDCVAVICAAAAVPKLEVRRWEWLALGIAGSILAIEASRLIMNFELYQAQWALQISRKAGRSIQALAIVSGAGLVLTVGGIVRGAARREMADSGRGKIQGLTILGFGLACILVQSFGQEMWYFPFILLGLILPAAALTGIFWPPQRVIRAVAYTSLVPALVLAAGLSTWLPGLRSKGVFGFHVAPGILTSLTSGLRIVDRQIHDMLRQQEAKRVIVTPFLYYSFLADIRHKPDIEAFTWNPLSGRTGERFDHAVLLIRGGPILNEMVPPVLSEYACTSETRIVSPDGYYEAAVVALAYRPSGRDAFAGCK